MQLDQLPRSVGWLAQQLVIDPTPKRSWFNWKLWFIRHLKIYLSYASIRFRKNLDIYTEFRLNQLCLRSWVNKITNWWVSWTGKLVELNLEVGPTIAKVFESTTVSVVYTKQFLWMWHFKVILFIYFFFFFTKLQPHIILRLWLVAKKPISWANESCWKMLQSIVW